MSGLSCADQHAVNLHVTMVLMHARTLATRADRVEYMTGKQFSGPHYGITRDVVVITREVAEYAADLIEAEEAEKANPSPTPA